MIPDFLGLAPPKAFDPFDNYTALPYSLISDCRNRKFVGIRSQVSALMSEEERAVMEFYIARAPEDHPVIPAPAASERPAGPAEDKGRVVASVLFTSSLRSRDASTWHLSTRSHESRLSRQPIRMCSQNLRRRSRER